MDEAELIGRERFGELCPTCLYSFVLDELDGYGLVTNDNDLIGIRITELLTTERNHHEREPHSNGNGMA